MNKLNRQGTLDLFKNEIEKTIIRFYIKSLYPKYDKNEIYVIYDGLKVEPYNKEIHEIKKTSKMFKSYLISFPIRFS